MATPVAAPVYSSVADLEQYPSPQTASRYAVIPGLGMFRWNGLSIASRNGTTVLGTANIGRWLLSDTFGNGSVWKQACFVAATTNLDLSGAETIDGQSITTQDVFCTAQTDPTQNGPWTASSSGAWTRPFWFSSSADVQPGAMFPIVAGDEFGGSLWILTSPTSGTITPGTSQLTFERAGGAYLAVEAFTRIQTLSRDSFQVMTADTLGECSFAMATTGHSSGKNRVLYCDANTVSADSKFAVPSDISGSFDPFAFDSPYAVVMTCVDDTDPGQFVASGYSLTARTTAAPTIVSAEIQSSDLDKLIVTFSAPMLVPSLTGCSLTGTTATLASIFSVNADKTVWTFDLSADITAGDPDIVLVLASTREWRALNGPLIAAGSTAVTTEYQWTTLTGLTFYFDPPTHCNVVTDGGAVTAINTTDGSGADFTGTATYRTTGLDGKPCIEGNGTSDVMTSATLISALMSDSAGYLALVCVVDTISTNDATTPSNNVMVAYTNGGGADHGFFFRSGGGTPKVVASIFATDGSGVSKTEQDISTGAPMLLELWHDAGTLYLSVNGGATTSIVAGNLLDHSAVLRLLRGPGGGAYFDGKLGKAFACSAVPGTTERAAFIAGIKAYYPSIP